MITLTELLDLLTDSEESRALTRERLLPMFDTSQEQRAPILIETHKEQALRVLANGEDVNHVMEGGAQVEIFEGPSRADVIDVLPPLRAQRTSRYQPNSVQISGGGGGTDCMFDHLVSECWADEVAAGRGTEGQEFTSLTGCTFQVWSTVQGAWNTAKGESGERVIWICPGDAGGLSVTGDNGHSSGVVFQGAGVASSIAASSVSFSHTAGTRTLTFIDLGIGATNTGTITCTETTGSSILLNFTRCVIGGGATPTFTSSSSTSCSFTACTFPKNSAGANYSLDIKGLGTNCVIRDCTFGDQMRVGSETYLHDTIHNLGTHAIGIIAEDRDLNVQGARFRGSGSFTYYMTFGTGTPADSLHVQGCRGTIGATAAIKVTTSPAEGGNHHQVSGNNWGCALGLDATGVSVTRFSYTNNAHSTSAPSAAFSYARGEFHECEFSGNGPGLGYVTEESGSVGNRIDGTQTGAGAPSHTANEGVSYFDRTNNVMYVNTSTRFGTTWTVHGASGGGPAAPYDAQYVTLAADADLTVERVLTSANGIDVIDGGAGSTVTLRATRIQDDDADTMIQAEESADEDILRFDTGGTERVTLSTAMSLVSTLLRLPVTAKTIATDQIAVPATSHMTLAGEGAAADDLDGITGGAEGDVLIASAVSDSVTITVKHNNAGGSSGAKIFTAGGTDITLDDIQDMVLFVYKSALDSGNGGWMAAIVGGGSSSGSGHTIRENGTDLTARTGLNFLSGVIATDDSGGDETEIRVDYGAVWALA